MRVTLPPDRDVEVRPGTPARDLARAAGLPHVWCGNERLDPDHPAGLAPLLHAARLTAEPWHLPGVPEGQYLEVVDGPDCGAVIPLRTPVLVGRAPHADLIIGDPAVSATHAEVTPGARPRVRDLGSANGVRGARARRIDPRTPLEFGRSRVALRGLPEQSDAPRDVRRGAGAWTGAGASVVGGLMIAAATGRWYLAVLGALYPATLIIRAGRERLSRRSTITDESRPWPTGPTAITGPDPLVRAYVRALTLHRGRAPTERRWHEPWHRWIEAAAPGDDVLVVDSLARAPSWCRSTVEVHENEVVVTVNGVATTSLPVGMTADLADAAARRSAAAAPQELPTRTHWGDLVREDASTPTPPPGATPGRRALIARIGVSDAGPIDLDLERDGPHLLVAGTTGSGKSVALETLVAALAHALPPGDLSVALIDFKGGAGLRGCMELPHVAGILTDLDGAQSRRALAAIAQELADRKTAFAKHGMSDLGQWEEAGGAPPRLLVVIDEYQEIAAQHADFVPEVARLAAQGRSLGLHLVLATQRPAGAVTPEVRANVGATLALRVASVSESRDVIGVPDAAQLPRQSPGRAILARGEDRVELQIAAPRADPSPSIHVVGTAAAPGEPLARVAARRHRASNTATPLWSPPLPTEWTGSPGGDLIEVALADDLVRRVHRPLTWNPHAGVVALVGPRSESRSGCLSSLAAQAATVGMRPVLLPHDPREAARVLALAEQHPEWLLVIDGAESVQSTLAEADGGAALDAVMGRLNRAEPTIVACAAHAPSRLASAAVITAVAADVTEVAAAPWGVPREHRAAPAPGRCSVSHGGQWWTAQATYGTNAPWHRPVAPLPRTVSPGAQAWGIGGDDARPIRPPDGHVAVVGPPGSARDALVATMAHAQVTTHDVAALAPTHAESIILTEPAVRDVRLLAKAAWRGTVDPVPVPQRVILIQHGEATAVQLPSP